jgi:gluconolactonase
MPAGSGQNNPLRDWQLDQRSITYVGRELQRPECILAERDGTLWSADARGGVMRIAVDGKQTLISQRPDHHADLATDSMSSLFSGTLPNGLAFARNGDILIANFGNDRLEIMTRRGETKIMASEVDGAPLGKVNFVLRDSRDRIWFTISTKINPWSEAISPAIADGYICVMDEKGIRIVADGFRFTNEIRMDAKEEWLYVAETTGKRVSRLRVENDGSLSGREIFGPSNLGPGLIDGITFDEYGNLWAAMILADRLIAITPRGDLLELFCDGDSLATARFESEFSAGGPVRTETLMACGGSLCPMLTSVTFGGQDLSTVYLGGLRANRIPLFRSPIAGLPMIHW